MFLPGAVNSKAARRLPSPLCSASIILHTSLVEITPTWSTRPLTILLDVQNQMLILPTLTHHGGMLPRRHLPRACYSLQCETAPIHLVSRLIEKANRLATSWDLPFSRGTVAHSWFRPWVRQNRGGHHQRPNYVFRSTCM